MVFQDTKGIAKIATGMHPTKVLLQLASSLFFSISQIRKSELSFYIIFSDLQLRILMSTEVLTESVKHS